MLFIPLDHLFGERFDRVAHNGLQLGEVADFGARNCQYTTKVDARKNVQLTTSPAISANLLLWAGFNTLTFERKLSHKEILIEPKLFLSK